MTTFVIKKGKFNLMTSKPEETFIPTKLHTRASTELEEEVKRELQEEDSEHTQATFREAIENKDQDE